MGVDTAPNKENVWVLGPGMDNPSGQYGSGLRKKNETKRRQPHARAPLQDITWAFLKEASPSERDEVLRPLTEGHRRARGCGGASTVQRSSLKRKGRETDHTLEGPSGAMDGCKKLKMSVRKMR